MNAYSQLEGKFYTLATQEDAAAILNWDAATMMPTGSAKDRSEQLAVLATIRHEILTGTEIEELMEAALKENTLNDWQLANLREMQWVYIHATAMETRLVTALSKATNACESGWRTARPDDDYDAV